ncbi:carbonic anhydrase [Actinomadura kijaniata]|uniref:carbonic anhydrase n=1 Tax=Actinomadura namibiensis TaxID=182080 RepID=A0A7W3LPH0_ACTNM|nr:carbonic anhydrase [Actinomadura namibiensis]MBA8951903.1 carbonic anhydrase [Actinomadura namibiensis]
MRSFIDHARTFRERAESEGIELGRFAAGQDPSVLFVTCSDSRVVPALITGAGPGELFELRTAGAVVPPYSDRPAGEAGTIEFAVRVLGVPDVVVCGHSRCAAVGALVSGDGLPSAPALRAWLDLAAEAPAGDDPDLAGQRHVLAQLERLRGYPAVADRLAAGDLRLHGWFYEVDTGVVRAHRPGDGVFPPL